MRLPPSSLAALEAFADGYGVRRDELGRDPLYRLYRIANLAIWLRTLGQEVRDDAGGSLKGKLLTLLDYRRRRRALRLLATDQPFRRFVITRALLMCSALSAPFYVALAQQNYGSPAYLLGAFVISAGLASLISAPLWGRFADTSSKRVMITAALVTSSTGLIIFLADSKLPQLSQTVWFLPIAYFVLMVAHAGVRVGRKTYVVNLAGGNKRTDYVAISNSVIGVCLLLVGTVGLLTPLIGLSGVIGLLALMGLLGAVLGGPPIESRRVENGRWVSRWGRTYNPGWVRSVG